MGYLDNTGLTYFWSKVKAALAEKQNILTAGPGIKIEGSTISSTGGGGTVEEFPIWVGSTLPSSANWNSVAYGNGRFVAVGWSSYAAYSTDGKTWAATDLPPSANWNSVAYGNGRFVVTGWNGNNTAYSVDGKIWTVVSLPDSVQWNDIAYGDKKFVVVPHLDRNGAYSEDGKSWAAMTLPSSADWMRVTYGNGRFVAVAYSSNKAAYSTDGITWTAATLPSSALWKGVVYGNGKFVAVAYSSNKAAYSTDGITWTAATLPSSTNWNSVAYGNGKFVAVAYSSNKAAYSTDGITWTAATLPSSALWEGVAYGNGKFVAAASNSATAAYAAFTDVTFEALDQELSQKGDNLSLDGQTLSLKNGSDVLSSVELPGGGSGEVYSTEETVVGTWIDGKPIYRKVFRSVSPVNIPIPDLSVDSVVRMDGFIQEMKRGTDYKYPLNIQETSAFKVYTFIAPFSDGMTIYMGTGTNELNGYPTTIVLEYTKTTDQATIELPALLTVAPEQNDAPDAPVSPSVSNDFEEV